MPGSYVGAGVATSGGGVTSVTINPGLPAGAAAGDLLLAVVIFYARTTGCFVQAGGAEWDALTEDTLNPFGTDGDGKLATFVAPYEVGMPTPAFNLFFGTAGTSTYIAQIHALRDMNMADILDAQAINATATSVTSFALPAITTTGPDRLLFGIGVKAAITDSASVGGGWTQAQPFISTAAGADASMLQQWRAAAAAGTVAAVTATMAGSSGFAAGKVLALKSAGTDLAIYPTFFDPEESETLFWNPVVSKASDLLISPTFLDTAEEFYAPTIVLSGITPDFLDSQTEFYTATVQVIAPGGEPEQPVVLQRFSAEVFPPGTIVTIHDGHRAWPDRAPIGPVLSMSTVDELGRFEASGLTDNRWYAAYGVVDGRHRYLRFRFEASPT